MDYVCRAVWGMLYADGACIASRSPQGLVNMREVTVDVCRAFARVGYDDRDHVHASTA